MTKRTQTRPFGLDKCTYSGNRIQSSISPAGLIQTTQPIGKMKKTILLIWITMANITPTFAQGYINFSWFGSGNPTAGVRIGSFSNPSSQLPGWYVSGDYSVEAWMAAGANQPFGSLVPIASTREEFFC